ncbi:hypothetical protein ACXHXG_14505 [Rhizobium sp. LEGMi198b]
MRAPKMNNATLMTVREELQAKMGSAAQISAAEQQNRAAAELVGKSTGDRHRH